MPTLQGDNTPPTEPADPGKGVTTEPDTGTTGSIEMDGCWSEPLDPEADVSDLEAAFNSVNAKASAIEVLQRRFPAGADLLVEMSHDPWIDVFLGTSSWVDMMDSLGTVVHEETHGWDYESALWGSTFGYWITGDLQIETPWVDALPRSAILPQVQGSGTALYDGTYLVGTQGTYGFTELLDEANCYVGSLGGTLAGADALPWGVSARDGAVAFLYYIELYLGLLRLEEPALYGALQEDPDMVELVRTLWLRVHFMLEFADLDPRLGIYDDAIRDPLYREDNQDEIELFLGHDIDASPCLP